MTEKTYPNSSAASSSTFGSRDLNDDIPVPYDIEASKEQDNLKHQLDTVMSNPNNLETLASLSRVLSTRRLAVTSSGAHGTLEINPDNFDLNVILRTLRTRFNDQGIHSKYTGLSFRDLVVDGVDAATTYGPSVSEFLRSCVTFPIAYWKLRRPQTCHIIQNVNGVIHPGEMVLVLGRPGSGCTTLLKTLSGEIDQFTAVEGRVSYDGASLEDMLKFFKSEVIYNPERKYSNKIFSALIC